ncbi:MAG: sulfotransferase [Coraliomargaritaceae bacterium]
MKTKEQDISDSLKVFCVGSHKTGTSSIHHFFKRSGLTSKHGSSWVSWCNSSRAHLLDQYQCFSDGKNPPIESLYERYPHAKFIYTSRDLRSWLISRHMHKRRNKRRLGFYFLILLGIKNRGGQQYHDEVVKTWPEQYFAHEKRVMEFFKDKPERLLVIDLTKNTPEKNSRQIHDFLGLPGEPQEFPHKNNSPDSMRESSVRAVDRVMKQMGISDKESIGSIAFSKKG